MTHLFLSVFYTKSELGFSMEDYSISDISPEIINLVDKMGAEIVTNVRIVTIASKIYDIAEIYMRLEKMI